MATRLSPRAAPSVKHVLHRVFQAGSATHDHEAADPAEAHAHAAALSASAGPHARFEVRGVPSHVAHSAKGPRGGQASEWVPNTDGRYEVVVALYQGGKQIPIT